MNNNQGQTEPGLWPAKATIDMSFRTPRLARIAAFALRPELADSPSDRTTANLVFKGGTKIHLVVSAKDTSALRAALNSYLRWVSAIVKAVSTLETSLDLDSLPDSVRTKRN